MQAKISRPVCRRYRLKNKDLRRESRLKLPPPTTMAKALQIQEPGVGSAVFLLLGGMARSAQKRRPEQAAAAKSALSYFTSPVR
jgi:hypothetical protein